MPLFKELIFKYRTNSNIEFLGPLTNDKVLSYEKCACSYQPNSFDRGSANCLSEASIWAKSLYSKNQSIEEFFPKNYKFTYLDKNEDSLKIFLIN